jgi:hypothetical protein
LSVDPLAALVDEHGGISRARVKFRHAVCDQHEVRVVPGAVADAIPRVCRLVAVGGIALHGEVGAPDREAQPFERRLQRGCAFIERFAKARTSGYEWETAGRMEGS